LGVVDNCAAVVDVGGEHCAAALRAGQLAEFVGLRLRQRNQHVSSFFAWYRGLALGGTARIGQLQLLQPFLSMAAGAALIGERVEIEQLATAALVVACVLAARKPSYHR